MNWKYLLILLFLYFVYLVVGAGIFFSIERPLEIERCNRAEKFSRELQLRFVNSENATFTEEEITYLVLTIAEFRKQGIQFCPQRLHDQLCPDSNYTVLCPVHWDFESSLFFCGTVVTTIGYGNVAPTADLSRAICVIYALVGIIIFAAMFNGLGGIFTHTIKHLALRIDKLDTKEWVKDSLIFSIFAIFGFTFFSFIPGVIFSVIEGWSFGIAVYYTIITLTTIGFGDYVAGSNPSLHYIALYRTMVLFWILFGLAFMATFFSVVSERLKHKSKGLIKGKRKKDKNDASDKENESTDKVIEVDAADSTNYVDKDAEKTPKNGRNSTINTISSN